MNQDEGRRIEEEKVEEAITDKEVEDFWDEAVAVEARTVKRKAMTDRRTKRNLMST